MLVSVLVGTLFFAGCKQPDINPDEDVVVKVEFISQAVTDYDGNTYDAVKINNQTWMAENLRSEHYADGTEIPMGHKPIVDNAGNITGYQQFEYERSSFEPYRYMYYGYSNLVPYFGYLYNWPAVMKEAKSSDSNPSGVQGVCPNGWHVPSDAEWKELERSLGMDSATTEKAGFRGRIANKMVASQSETSFRWTQSSTQGTPGSQDSTGRNVSQLSMLPSGKLYDYGVHGFPVVNWVWNSYNWSGECAAFWTSTEMMSLRAWYRELNYDKRGVNRGNYYNNDCGYSVRCVKN